MANQIASSMLDLSALTALQEAAEIAKAAKAKVDAAFEKANEARSRQRAIAMEAWRSLRQPIGLPWGQGRLIDLPDSPPSDPFMRALFQKARETKKALLGQAEAVIAEIAEPANKALDAIVDAWPVYAAQAGARRPFASLNEAMRAISKEAREKEPQSRMATKPKTAKATKKAKSAPKPKAKAKGKKTTRKPASKQAALRVLKEWGASAIVAPSGVVQIAHPKFGRIDMRGDDEKVAAILTEAVRQGREALRLGGDEEAAIWLAFAHLRKAAK